MQQRLRGLAGRATVRGVLSEVIATPRLCLSRVSPERDADELFAAYTSSPQVARFMPWDPHRNLSTTRRYLRTLAANWEREVAHAWTVRLHSGRIAGMVFASSAACPTASFGYGIVPGLWGRGLATEAASAVVSELASQHQVVRIWAACEIANVASARVLEKVGLSRHGYLAPTDRTPAYWTFEVSRRPDGTWPFPALPPVEIDALPA